MTGKQRCDGHIDICITRNSNVMMNIEDARRLGLMLFELGFTPWLQETGDGFTIRLVLNGEMVDVFWTNCESVGNN